MSFFTYCLWLLVQITNSTWKVLKIIWYPHLKISPKYGFCKTILTNKTKKVIFANSITLTPGTFTIELIDNELLVHSLCAEDLNNLPEGMMEKKVDKIQLGIK